MSQSGTNLYAPQTYTQYFPTNPWGGKVSTFTVPAGVSVLKLTAVATGGCLAGSSTTAAMSGTANNVIFARLNGTDPAFISFAQANSGYMSIGLAGKYVYGSVLNSAAAGINGSGDVTSTGRMNGNYFNALDAKPWGISVSQGSGTGQVISATTDGFNFIHTSITTSSVPILYSCVFGGNGTAMVAIGTTATANLYYTNNYGATWTNLSGVSITAATRVRYLNGYWIAIHGSTTFQYTNAPLTAAGAAQAWTSSNAITTGITDIAWTGTTAIALFADATNVQISAWAAGAAPSGTWASQAHGGDLAFDTCETSSTGEVLLFKTGTATTSATSVRATSGAATSYNSVGLYASQASESLAYNAVTYAPFTGGSMWVMVGGANANVYTTTSAVTAPSITKLAITAASAGNARTNATAINNVQYLGNNYVSLSSTNGLGKYSAAGVITASLSSAAQLTTEFGYTDTTYWAPSLVVAKNGSTVLTLQGGGTGGGVSLPGAGGGNQYFVNTTTMTGMGPTGYGAVGGGVPFGNGGGVIAGATSTFGGGGTWMAQSAQYAPLPNTIVPGACGGPGTQASFNSGGGGSLFGSAGFGTAAPSFSDPGVTYANSSRVGSWGAGCGGAKVLTSTFNQPGGGAQGCYQYSISCNPGDTITLTLPGCCYVSANGATGTNGGPGGESYAYIQYNA